MSMNWAYACFDYHVEKVVDESFVWSIVRFRIHCGWLALVFEVAIVMPAGNLI